jgi:hypothetical protein
VRAEIEPVRNGREICILLIVLIIILLAGFGGGVAIADIGDGERANVSG